MTANNHIKQKAVILLSGGLDSATTLAIAQHQGFQCYALSFNYGQRHAAELTAAKQLADVLGAVEHRTVGIDLRSLGGSALTDSSIAVPHTATVGIPVTYVPARNTIFLAFALAWAEVLRAPNIFIGVNAVDYSGYPDCRPEYIAAFETMANLATREGIEGRFFKVHTPLMTLSKEQIIEQGIQLGVDYSLTVSCYAADDNGRACGRCDSCRFRAQGFARSGLADPTKYQK